MTGLYKEKLIYNYSLGVEGDNVGAWTLDGYGNAIGSTGNSLNVTMTTGPLNDSPFATNYGVVDGYTMRTAAQIGNATGAADFNVGAPTAQTLRTISDLADGYGNQISSFNGALNVTLTNSTGTGAPLDMNYGTVGANTLRTAAQIGNATGAADFNLGASTAQTLRVASNLADGYGTALSSTGSSLNVNITNTDASDGIYFEDSPHVSGDRGSFSLAVRQDALVSSVDTDGDYAAFKLNSRGALWSVPVGTVADGVADTENPVKVGTRSVAAPLAGATAGNRSDMISDLYRRLYVNDNPNVAVQSQAVTVTTSAIALPTTALGGRMRLVVQNLGNNAIFVGPSGVTTSSGMRVSAGATLVVELGDSVNLYGIANSGSQNVRVFEMA